MNKLFNFVPDLVDIKKNNKAALLDCCRLLEAVSVKKKGYVHFSAMALEFQQLLEELAKIRLFGGCYCVRSAIKDYNLSLLRQLKN